MNTTTALATSQQDNTLRNCLIAAGVGAAIVPLAIGGSIGVVGAAGAVGIGFIEQALVGAAIGAAAVKSVERKQPIAYLPAATEEAVAKQGGVVRARINGVWSATTVEYLARYRENHPNETILVASKEATETDEITGLRQGHL